MNGSALISRTRILLLPLGLASTAAAQEPPATRGAPPPIRMEVPASADSAGQETRPWEPLRVVADGAEGRRIVISLRARRLWLIDNHDTLLAARVAVGKGTRLTDGTREWDFSTPTGVRSVIRKERDPVWVPPDWHYVELARDRALTLVRLERGSGVMLADGSRVLAEGERVRRVRSDGDVEEIPPGEELLFGDTLFLPPLGTANRRIVGELGAYKLDLGDGYLIHGTPHKDSIGTAATHGCIRLEDDALALLYRSVPVGTRVYIY